MVRKLLLCLTVLACMALGIFAAFYTRPLPLSDFFPGVDLADCTEIRGYYTADPKREDLAFSLTPDDPDFEPLRKLFASATFRRSLLPAAGGQMHRWQEGDFRWTATLNFEEPVPLSDGSMASGTLLRIDDFFGKITVHADGNVWRCKAEPSAFRNAAAEHIRNHLNHLETEN